MKKTAAARRPFLATFREARQRNSIGRVDRQCTFKVIGGDVSLLQLLRLSCNPDHERDDPAPKGTVHWLGPPRCPATFHQRSAIERRRCVGAPLHGRPIVSRIAANALRAIEDGLQSPDIDPAESRIEANLIVLTDHDVVVTKQAAKPMERGGQRESTGIAFCIGPQCVDQP